MIPYRRQCTTMALSAGAATLPLVLLPGPFLGLFGVEAPVLGPLLGFVFLALAGTLWGVRDVEDPAARTAVILGNAVCDAGATGVLVWATVAGSLPVSGWVLAAVFAVNALSWAATAR